jgi:hypothetical protein
VLSKFYYGSVFVVNQKLEHVEDISFRELFGRIRVVFYKIRFVSSIFNLSEACDCMFCHVFVALNHTGKDVYRIQSTVNEAN